MPKKHDWEGIKRDYVQGYFREDGSRFAEPRYSDVAKRHNVSESMMRKKGGEEKWTEHRRMFLARMEHEAKEKRIDAFTEHIVAFDAECAETAGRLLGMIKGKMNQAFTVGEDGRQMVTANATDLQALASALVKAQAVGRLSMGESTENNKTEWVTITPDLGMA